MWSASETKEHSFFVSILRVKIATAPCAILVVPISSHVVVSLCIDGDYSIHRIGPNLTFCCHPE